MAGLFEYLSNTMQSPLFLGGAAMFGGGGMEGAMQGMRTGAGLQDQQRQRQLADQRQQAFGQLLGKGGIEPQTAAMASAMGPDGGLEYLAKMSDPMRALEMQKAKADLAAAPLDLEYRRAQINKLSREPAGGELPSNIREWQMYQQMNPEDQLRYLTMKRSEKYLDLGTNYSRPDPTNPAGPPIATFQKDVAGEAAQKQEGEARGKAAANLPIVERNAAKLISNIDGLMNDPYLENMLGSVDSRLPNLSSSADRVQGRMEQIQGQTFLQAFNDLRGGGAITEAEGAKATQSYNRLARTAVGTKDYIDALNEFKSDVVDLVEIARAKAGVSQGAPSVSGQHEQPQSNSPAPRSGFKYIGPAQ